MRNARNCNHSTSLNWRGALLIAVIFVAASAFALQDSPALMATTPKHRAPAAKQEQGQAQEQAHTSKGVDVSEYGPLMNEFSRVLNKIQQSVDVPAPRTQSKLLPAMPASTSFFLSMPNYGEALYQANQVFNREVQESSILREWWQNKAGMAAMMMQGVVEQVHQFMGYLGDEIVISGNMKQKGPTVLVMAEIRKPGLGAFLQQLMNQYGGKNSPVEILTPQQLLTAKAPAKGKQFLLLVRRDFLVISGDLATLRSANAQLNTAAHTFSSTPFGQRLAQAYQGGVGMLAGADLQKLMAIRPKGKPQEEAMLKQTGFADLKFLIMDGKYANGVSSGNVEVTFNGPRQGIAGWLGAPSSLGALDFVSPNAASAAAISLKNPAEMFDDVRHIAESANPMASAGIAQAETQLNLNLKDDLFSKLGGEIGFAIEDYTDPTMPAVKVILRVSDPQGLQKTLNQLTAAVTALAGGGSGLKVEQKTEDGITYTDIAVSSSQKPQDFAYALTDGYLVFASTPALLKEAIQGHRSGNSLAKSAEFRRLLPPEHGDHVSALFFQNSSRMMKAMLKQLPPEAEQILQAIGGKDQFSVTAVTADENSIRASGNSGQFSMLMPLVIAAVAIPNLMKSKSSAEEASAAANVRILNTAEVQYQITYGKFAPDLATLGPGSEGACDKPTEQNACLVEGSLAAANCSSGNWCTKGAFQYSIVTKCEGEACNDYAVVATPAGGNAGQKSFCSTSDAVVRSKSGPPLNEPVNAAECQTWQPI